MGRKPAASQAIPPAAVSQEMFGEPLYTVKEVARSLGLTEETVRDWIKAGDLMALRFGRKEYRITQSALRQYKEDREAQAKQEYEARREERRLEAELARLHDREPWAFWQRTACPHCGENKVLTTRRQRKDPRFVCEVCYPRLEAVGGYDDPNAIERAVRIQVDEYNAEAGVRPGALPEYLIYNCGVCERPQMLSAQQVQDLTFYPYCSHSWSPPTDQPNDSNGPYDERVLAVLAVLELETVYAGWYDFSYGQKGPDLPNIPRRPEALRKWLDHQEGPPPDLGPYALKLCPKCERNPVVVNKYAPKHIVVFCRECLRKDQAEAQAEARLAGVDEVLF